MLSIFAQAFFVATRTEDLHDRAEAPADETCRRRMPRLAVPRDPAVAAA